MIIAKVIGSAVAILKHDALHSSKLLLVSPADAQRRRERRAVPRRGPGRRRRGRAGGGQPGQLGPHGDRANTSPVDAAIVGILDSLQIDGDVAFRKE